MAQRDDTLRDGLDEIQEQLEEHTTMVRALGERFRKEGKTELQALCQLIDATGAPCWLLLKALRLYLKER